MCCIFCAKKTIYKLYTHWAFSLLKASAREEKSDWSTPNSQQQTLESEFLDRSINGKINTKSQYVWKTKTALSAQCWESTCFFFWYAYTPLTDKRLSYIPWYLLRTRQWHCHWVDSTWCLWWDRNVHSLEAGSCQHGPSAPHNAHITNSD